MYDPLGMEGAERVLNRSVRYARSAEECVRHAHLVVIATPWDEFKKLRPQQFAHDPPRVVLDCWRILPAEELGRVAKYLTIGKGDALPLAANRER